jgi:hypothetical protein
VEYRSGRAKAAGQQRWSGRSCNLGLGARTLQTATNEPWTNKKDCSWLLAGCSFVEGPANKEMTVQNGYVCGPDHVQDSSAKQLRAAELSGIIQMTEVLRFQ